MLVNAARNQCKHAAAAGIGATPLVPRGDGLEAREKRPSGAPTAPVQLLHSALLLLPQPSLLSSDLERQLLPLLGQHRGISAASLEAAALDGTPLQLTSRLPTQKLQPDIPAAPPSLDVVDGAPVPSGLSGGGGGDDGDGGSAHRSRHIQGMATGPATTAPTRHADAVTTASAVPAKTPSLPTMAGAQHFGATLKCG